LRAGGAALILPRIIAWSFGAKFGGMIRVKRGGHVAGEFDGHASYKILAAKVGKLAGGYSQLFGKL
jgi:hypothetical protein